jgi:rod shape-determining protein MreD
VRWLLLAILGYGCLVAETALFRPGALALQVDAHWVRPDLLLALGLFVALFFDPTDVFIIGWVLGMASDLVSIAGRLGLKALLFCIILFLVSQVRQVVPRTRILGQSAACLVTVFAVHLVWYTTTRLLAGGELWLLRSAEESILDALYTAALAPYLFWLLLWLREPLRASVGGERD